MISANYFAIFMSLKLSGTSAQTVAASGHLDDLATLDYSREPSPIA